MQHERETGNCISLVCLRLAKLCALSNPYLNDMRTLPTVMPEVYDAFQTSKVPTQDAFDSFLILWRCSSDATITLFDPLKKLKLKSFKNLKAVQSCVIRML